MTGIISAYAHLKDVPSFQGKKVLLRADLNVPFESGVVGDRTRLVRSLKTLRFLKERGAQIILLSHLGRPKGKIVSTLSFRPVAHALGELAPDLQVVFCPFFKGEEAASFIQKTDARHTIFLENLRFDPGEEQNNPHFVRNLARLGDFYVNDAFSASHRAHGSIQGLPQHLPAAAGFFFDEEVRALMRVLETPERPLMALVAGAKISTKLALLKNLLQKVDVLAIGGAMAHTFLKAQGVPIGASLREDRFIEVAQEIIALASEKNCTLLLPIDGIVAEKLAPGTTTRIVTFGAEEKSPLQPHESIFDVGPQTVAQWVTALKSCKTFVWNGPLGAFEIPPFGEGTQRFAETVANLTDRQELCSIAGGGDTLASLGRLSNRLTYASGSGGAFLEWLEGKHLPGLKALEEAYLRFIVPK